MQEDLMFVSDWITKKVFVVSPDDSISEAAKITKEHGIKHLPVVKGKKVVGILSDRDIKEYVPSKATSLDVYELHYLLAKTRVKEIMKKKVYTTSPDTPIEEAALVMHDNNIGCLPVVDKKGLIGIISDKDIFQVLVDITGIRHGGHRVFLLIEDKPGSIKDVADIIRKHGYSLTSVLTSYEGVKEGLRAVIIRMKGKGNFKAMKEELEGTFRSVRIKKG
jgi:acetoin utilization protein AcuB